MDSEKIESSINKITIFFFFNSCFPVQLCKSVQGLFIIPTLQDCIDCVLHLARNTQSLKKENVESRWNFCEASAPIKQAFYN